MPGHVPDREGANDLRADNPYYYYQREERLALPNRPAERKRYKSSRYLIYVIDVILLFMAYQCVISPRIGKQGDAVPAAPVVQSSAAVLRGDYRFQLKLEREPARAELRLIVNRRDGAPLILPSGFAAVFFHRAGGTDTRLAREVLPDSAGDRQPFLVLATAFAPEKLPTDAVPGVLCPVPGTREEIELLLDGEDGR